MVTGSTFRIVAAAAVLLSWGAVPAHAQATSSSIPDGARVLATTLPPEVVDATREAGPGLMVGSWLDQQTLARWQRDYDLVLGQKDAAKRKMLYGLLANGAGVALALIGAASCDFYSCDGSEALAVVGLITSLGGSGVFVWGMIEYFDARGEISRLERNKPTGLSIALSEHQALMLSLGERTSVGYKLVW